MYFFCLAGLTALLCQFWGSTSRERWTGWIESQGKQPDLSGDRKAGPMKRKLKACEQQWGGLPCNRKKVSERKKSIDCPLCSLKKEQKFRLGAVAEQIWTSDEAKTVKH